MELTPEQINVLLEEAKPSIVNGLKEEAIKQIKWEFNSQVSRLMEAEVTKFVSTEIIPVLQQQLIESKEGLINIVLASSNAGEKITLQDWCIVTDLSKALMNSLKEKLEHSYSRQKIFEAMFK